MELCTTEHNDKEVIWESVRH